MLQFCYPWFRLKTEGGFVGTERQRLGSIDDVRVILMLLGLVVHAALQVQGVGDEGAGIGLWSWLAGSIHVFRMQAFFALSGYLSWKAMQRERYIAIRLRQLLVPAVFAVFLLFPLMSRRLPSNPFGATFDLSSAWFLATLSILIVVNQWLYSRGVLHGLIAYAQRHPVATFGTMIVIQLVVRQVIAAAATIGDWSHHNGLLFAIANSVRFENYYLGGILLSQLSQWQRVVSGPAWPVAGAVTLVGWMVATWFYPALTDGLIVSTICAIVLSAAVMSIAIQGKFRLGLPGALCAASLTVYLWHLPLIIHISNIYHKLHLPQIAGMEFGVIGLGALGTSLVAHRAICMSSWLRWLCLGQPLPASHTTTEGTFLNHGSRIAASGQ